jgi:F-type H+-transporting ATPase subunit epsilon
MSVQVVAPDGVVWEGTATTATVPSALGSLGIMRRHESVAAVLTAGEVRVTPTAGEPRSFGITGGFVVVDDDDVTVLVDALTERRSPAA